MITITYPLPRNEDQFESLCLDLFRREGGGATEWPSVARDFHLQKRRRPCRAPADDRLGFDDEEGAAPALGPP